LGGGPQANRGAGQLKKGVGGAQGAGQKKEVKTVPMGGEREVIRGKGKRGKEKKKTKPKIKNR